MNKKSRVEAALKGRPVDRIPFSLWMHFPDEDEDPEKLAARAAGFARRHDVDFIVSMPSGTFAVEDWGTVGDHSGVILGKPSQMARYGVSQAADWADVGVLDVRSGVLGRELRQIELLLDAVGDIPVVPIVYLPLTVLKKLAGDAYREHLKTDEAAVRRALDNIVATFSSFIREALALGCAGIYFSSQETSHLEVSEEFYRRFGLDYDRQLIAAAADGWFNVLHLHGHDIIVPLMDEFDVDALHWHIGETAPSIADYRRNGGAKAILGGLRRAGITAGDVDATRQDMETAIRESNGRGLLLGPSCVIHYPVSDEALADTSALLRSQPAAPL